MQLEINKEEIFAVLLEWAEKQWPGCFNTVEIESSYSTIDSSDSTINGATFSKEEPTADDNPE